MPGPAIDFRAVQRALIIKLRHHGDVLLAAPVLTALKHAAPQCLDCEATGRGGADPL